MALFMAEILEFEHAHKQCLRTLYYAVSATLYSYANPKVPLVGYYMQVAIAMLTTLAHDDKWNRNVTRNVALDDLNGPFRVELAEALVQCYPDLQHDPQRVNAARDIGKVSKSTPVRSWFTSLTCYLGRYEKQGGEAHTACVCIET